MNERLSHGTISVNHPEMDAKVREWLKSDEGQRVLDRVARAVVRSAASRGLSYAFLTKDPLGDYPPDDLVEDVRSELALFIVEHSARFSEMLATGQGNPSPLLKNAFLNHWIEKTRTAAADPQRFFYKRVQDVLRSTDDFHLLSERGKPLRFSLTSGSRPTQPLTREDIQAIPFPTDLPRQYESVTAQKAILRLSRHFWAHVSRMWGDLPVWVELRSLVDWVTLHVPLRPPEKQEKDRADESVLNQIPDDDGSPDMLPVDRDAIIRWAGQFSNRLTQNEKDVFRLVYGEGLKLKEVAKRLSYKASSGAAYPLERVHEKMRLFLRDLPWLSPDDSNPEAFSLFTDTLISVLKKPASTP